MSPFVDVGITPTNPKFKNEKGNMVPDHVALAHGCIFVSCTFRGYLLHHYMIVHGNGVAVYTNIELSLCYVILCITT